MNRRIQLHRTIFEQEQEFESEHEYDTLDKRETNLEREIEEKNDEFDSGNKLRENTESETYNTKKHLVLTSLQKGTTIK